VFRRRDGVWAGSVTVGYDEHGKRKRRTLYGGTKGSVLEKLARLRADALAGTLGDPQRLTVAAFLHLWLEDVARPSVRASVHRRYADIVRLRIVPQIGGIALSRLTPVHVQSMLTSLENKGVSPRGRQMAYDRLHRALGQAVQWGMVPRNVCDAVTRPRAPRPTMQVLTPEQSNVLLTVARGDRFYALYVLAVTTGLRQGELLGLQWGDVDLAGAVLHVRHALHEMAGRLWLDEPKTAKARRAVDLSAVAVAALPEHRERMLAEGHPLEFVFCDSHGGPVRKSNLIRRSFLPLLKRAGLPRIRFHDLRHTAATLLLLQGVHPKVVQERFGHSQISITLDTYSHVLPSMGREAAAKLDALFDAVAVAKL
jgi:integrase